MDQDETNHGYHQPVLAGKVAELMAPVLPGMVIDATFGGGGHTRRLLAEFGDAIEIVVIDRDPEALANAEGLPVTVIQGNFADMERLVSPLLKAPPAAVLFDFGVSSHQLDQHRRGFSYHGDGPLDMRMGPDAETSAHHVVNQWPQEELTRIFRQYGEEPLASRISAAIVSARPIESTARLSTVIAEATPAARRRAGHPARRVFQAIRIAVNSELEAVGQGVDAAIGMVRPGGRVIAISYHSLEDRIVKRRFAQGARGCVCPPGLPECGCGQTAGLRLLTRKAIRATPDEIESNRRARSAVLRAVEKVAA